MNKIKKTGVYCYIGENNEILYFGESNNIPVRINQEKNEKFF